MSSLTIPRFYSATILKIGCLTLSIAVFGIGFIAVSIGIVNLNKLCWKILFFSLLICVLGCAIIIITFFILVLFNADYMFSYVETNPLASCHVVAVPAGFSIRRIIILYYLTHKDVVSSFGAHGPAATTLFILLFKIMTP